MLDRQIQTSDISTLREAKKSSLCDLMGLKLG